MKILITCFGPFPGAPANPTERIARRIQRSRRLALKGIKARIVRFETVWRAAFDAPAAISREKPDAVVMLGLAGRRRHISVEARGTRHWSPLHADAEGARLGSAPPPGRLQRRSIFNAAAIAALLKRSGAECRLSRDAGTYLCNACYYTALGAGPPVLFIHVPGAMPRLRPKVRTKRRRMRANVIEQACLLAVLEAARLARRKAVPK